MGIEAVTSIASLNVLWPLAGDPRSEGDDHIRLIKSAILLTFPNINAAVDATAAQLNLLTGFSAANQLAALDANRIATSIVGMVNTDYGTTSSISPSYNSYGMVHAQCNTGPFSITVSGTKADGRNLKIFLNNNTGATLTVNWTGLGAANYIPNAAASTSVPTGYTLFDIWIINGREQMTIYNQSTFT